MATSICDRCGGTYHWRWEEAFDKFGFGDGDGQVETATVEAVLNDAGYATRTEIWGMHNTVIFSIKKNGSELMPVDDPEIHIGYADPRAYLPAEIVALLDAALPEKDSGHIALTPAQRIALGHCLSSYDTTKSYDEILQAICDGDHEVALLWEVFEHLTPQAAVDVIDGLRAEIDEALAAKAV